MRGMVWGVAALAIVSTAAEAKQYPRELLKGAAEIVNNANNSKGRTTAAQLRRYLESYMRAVSVSFPATFQDVTGDVTVLRFEEDKNYDGRVALVMVVTMKGDPREKRIGLYFETATEAAGS